MCVGQVVLKQADEADVQKEGGGTGEEGAENEEEKDWIDDQGMPTNKMCGHHSVCLY